MARIYLEVKMVSVNTTFEFSTDNRINTGEFKKKIAEKIQETSSHLVQLEEFSLFSTDRKAILSENVTLEENHINSGDTLLLI